MSRRVSSLLSLSAFVLVLLCVPVSAGAAVTCDRVAAPSGSDSAAGTVAAPLRTLEALLDAVEPGQTACLRGGTYGGVEPRLHDPDSELTSYPGETATITSMLEVMNTAKRSHVHHLRFDATNFDSTAAIKIQADDAVLSDNHITKGGKSICVQVASSHIAYRVRIERNRIYNCGPANSKFDHQLYLEQSRDAVVRQNILTGNAGGWGVHLYSDADGSLIEHNIIDGNRGGVIFAGDGNKTSDNNEVRNNAVTNSGPRWNIEGSWSGGPRGSGNTAHHNCLYTAGPDGPGGVERTAGGFTPTSNHIAGGSPYVNRSRGDLRFKSGSACDRLVGAVAGPSVRTARISSVRIALSLRARRRLVRPGGLAKLRGRLVAPARAAGAKVRIQVRRRGAWRTLAVRRTSAKGRFTLRLRAGKTRHARITRLRAVVRGVAKSRTVRLRVRPR